MDRLIRFGKDVVNGWLDAGAFSLAASLAYYAIFSIAPLILIFNNYQKRGPPPGVLRRSLKPIQGTASHLLRSMFGRAGTP
jgi:hypothetical protein